MELEQECIDVENLKEDLVDYFTTAINPFDVGLADIEEIRTFSDDKIVNIAKSNGFNMEHYKIK